MNKKEIETIFTNASHYVQQRYGNYPEQSTLTEKERQLQFDAAIDVYNTILGECTLVLNNKENEL